MRKNNIWFSIIEILIWMLIFTVGLTWIYALILSTMSLNDYSKNSIIATNLARESIENVRNIRDNNYNDLFKWNKLPWSNSNNLFSTWVYYKIENDYNNLSDNIVKFDIISDFAQGKLYLNNKMENYRLCLDSENRYTYDCSSHNRKTYFYRYIKFEDVIYNDSWTNKYISWALKLISKVIWYNRGYHEIELKTILTDYLRQ